MRFALTPVRARVASQNCAPETPCWPLRADRPLKALTPSARGTRQMDPLGENQLPRPPRAPARAKSPTPRSDR